MTYIPAAVAAPLNLVTLGLVLLVLIAAYLFFLRKKSNRHPMDTPEGKAAMEQHRRDAEAERRAEGRETLDQRD
ncbi:hypothetical protein [Sphingomicrobium sediminis]|uniref:Uncharacterized protein n=1 Tax=Sphingomicrobium sediminis TaxID=2950949 RepID=A0A9X2EEE7_9SPHN|nr:hypothetical protein [Sphingomicrobium sediminis]MCM8556498.1 hypothetical protein [Sphingomicrobium sediminis]